jgi:hypothetical protein
MARPLTVARVVVLVTDAEGGVTSTYRRALEIRTLH